MDKWGTDFTHSHKGRTFKITKLGIDISDEWGRPAGTVKLSHKIEGFRTPVYMIIDLHDKTFGFAHRISEEGSTGGLLVTLQDEKLFGQVRELIRNIEYCG